MATYHRPVGSGDAELPMTADEEEFEEKIAELLDNGVSEVDARAALTHCLGDFIKASKLILEVSA